MVNVDTVYQRVLALANKEQRGYITPQEFNLFANQAQMDIFEQYFYDLNQFLRVPGNNTEHADMVNILEEKIGLFEASATNIVYDGGAVIPSNVYRLSTVRYNNDGKHILINRVSEKELRMISLGPLTRPSKNNPVYVLKGSDIFFSPITPAAFDITYIKKPITANWSYIVVGEKALVNPNPSVGYMDFELHPSEETKLVIKILGLAGITLKDSSLYQVASTEDNKSIQQEKQ